MALEGTLHDFALADILQLIALQKKTGLLTLRGPDDTVILGFDGGALVTAESQARRVDTRLGTLLVKTRSLSPDALAKALEIQGQTLQRLGFILLKNGFCDADQLRAGLDAQVRKIAYGLFRWVDGDYVFDQQDRVDYDREYVRPIQVESLLMEGARMLDEWPIIQKVVRSPEIVYQRIPVGQRVEPAEGADDVEEIGDATHARLRERRDGAIRISRAEWSVYELVDGRRSIGDIVERTFLSDFEGAKAFFDLLSRGLIEEARRTGVVDETGAISLEIPAVRPGRSIVPVLLGAGLLALGLLGVSLQPRNPANVFTVPSRRVAAVEGFQKAVSLSRLRRISEAVDAYYLTQGRFPESPTAIVNAG
ncbi:MAG: DUF4388 domain-containing protein, partial [Thermoanaerobaculia bacterium]|nr:DUF4388 domain-containing protein [Thermoanaerobaculia bacterium]